MCAIYVELMCAGRIGGWAHDVYNFACHMFMHTYLQIPYIFILICLVLFCVLLSLSPFISCSMAPKQKSTSSRNPLYFGASSSDSTPSHFRFRDDNAHKDFLENFSQRGIHSKRQVILSEFSDTVGVRSHCVASDDVPLRDHARVLLQYAWIWIFYTSFCHSHLRYAYHSHSGSYIRGATL